MNTHRRTHTGVHIHTDTDTDTHTPYTHACTHKKKRIHVKMHWDTHRGARVMGEGGQEDRGGGELSVMKEGAL